MQVAVYKDSLIPQLYTYKKHESFMCAEAELAIKTVKEANKRHQQSKPVGNKTPILKSKAVASPRLAKTRAILQEKAYNM